MADCSSSKVSPSTPCPDAGRRDDVKHKTHILEQDSVQQREAKLLLEMLQVCGWSCCVMAARDELRTGWRVSVSSPGDVAKV